MKTETLSIDLLRLDGGSQARIKTSEETVEDYVERIAAGNGEWLMGPLDVFHDGADYFVADGFHRTLAALRSKRASLPCRVHKGTAKDAKIFGMTANDKHGLRMTRADKRACVDWLLDNGGKLTQVEIAEKSGADLRTVKRIVAERKPEKVTMSPVGQTKTQGKPSVPDAEPVPRTPREPGDEQDDDPVPGSADVPFDAPVPPAAKPKNGKETVSAASLVDALTKAHIGPLARGLTLIAEANGGEGKQFALADKGLNQIIPALVQMRAGEQ